MAITGYLAEFSLAEIFQFLEQGQKTGLLTITPLPERSNSAAPHAHYIWFIQGRIVAAANCLDRRGLVSLISRRGWVGDRAITRLAQTVAPKRPLGLALKSQGLLRAEQLKLLFYVQVMQQVCTLFAIADGWFHFDLTAQAPAIEMTGLNAPATETTLAGLRALKDWSALKDKLPDPSSTIVSTVQGQPQLKLSQSEWQIWEFTNGDMSLDAIAQQLQLSIEKVLQIVFRLMVVGLIEEAPRVISAPQPEPLAIRTQAVDGAEHTVSQSFLHHLMSFLVGQT
ncbi:MAG: DUF4388 domain-containing protein [Elainellaceae cyanobacterium]